MNLFIFLFKRCASCAYGSNGLSTSAGATLFAIGMVITIILLLGASLMWIQHKFFTPPNTEELERRKKETEQKAIEEYNAMMKQADQPLSIAHWLIFAFFLYMIIGVIYRLFFI